jgi:hypothetical protein
LEPRMQRIRFTSEVVEGDSSNDYNDDE